jgi:pimeloyl-ACP methyl ester carboxylesterase
MTTVEESVHLDVGSHSLAATVVAPWPRVPGVLFIHGWGGSQSQYLTRARQVAALGCVCLTFDLSGHEATHGQWTTVSRETNFRDVLAAYDLLASRTEVDASTMAVVGSSYGGYLGAILTAERPVRWLAMRVPALYYDDGWELPKLQLHRDFDLISFRRRRVAAVENRALRACAAFRGDVLLVESEHDEIVPHPVIQSYREACEPCCSFSYQVMPGADHGLSDARHQQAYTTLLVRWLAERLAAGPDAGQRSTAAAAAVPEVPPKTVED